MKLCIDADFLGSLPSRSREGAWIEIIFCLHVSGKCYSRSREGAWIEIADSTTYLTGAQSRSREGAWIEISSNSLPHFVHF